MKKILLSFLILILSTVFGSNLFFGTVVVADCKEETYGNVTIKCPDNPEEIKTSEVTYEQAITTAVTYIMFIIGILSVIFIILGGIMYATSAGDEAKATKARKIVTGAVIGLVFAILASAIVGFISTQIGQ